MKQIQSHAPGSADTLELVDVPKPKPGLKQVLIRVEAASVNFSDIMRRRADPYPIPTAFPYVPGSEVAGVVEELGDDAPAALLGARVFALAGTAASGGYAEYAIAASDYAIPIPESMTAAQAAGLTVAGVTATLMLTDAVNIGPRETVLVQGSSGGVGSYAVAIGKLLGARVIATASSPERRTHAQQLGADTLIDSADDAWPDAVLAATGGKGADVVLEAGGATTFEGSLRALAPFGTVIVYGFASGKPLEMSRALSDRFFYLAAPNQSLRAFNLAGYAFGRSDHFRAAMQRLMEWTVSRAITIPITTMPLARAREAHRMLESRTVMGKLVLIPA